MAVLLDLVEEVMYTLHQCTPLARLCLRNQPYPESLKPIGRHMDSSAGSWAGLKIDAATISLTTLSEKPPVDVVNERINI